MEGWRASFTKDQRRNVVNYIVEKIEKCLPEPRADLQRRAFDLEKHSFFSAASQDAYLEVIGKQLDRLEAKYAAIQEHVQAQKPQQPQHMPKSLPSQKVSQTGMPQPTAAVASSRHGVTNGNFQHPGNFRGGDPSGSSSGPAKPALGQQEVGRQERSDLEQQNQQRVVPPVAGHQGSAKIVDLDEQTKLQDRVLFDKRLAHEKQHVTTAVTQLRTEIQALISRRKTVSDPVTIQKMAVMYEERNRKHSALTKKLQQIDQIMRLSVEDRDVWVKKNKDHAMRQAEVAAAKRAEVGNPDATQTKKPRLSANADPNVQPSQGPKLTPAGTKAAHVAHAAQAVQAVQAAQAVAQGTLGSQAVQITQEPKAVQAAQGVQVVQTAQVTNAPPSVHGVASMNAVKATVKVGQVGESQPAPKVNPGSTGQGNGTGDFRKLAEIQTKFRKPFLDNWNFIYKAFSEQPDPDSRKQYLERLQQIKKIMEMDPRKAPPVLSRELLEKVESNLVAMLNKLKQQVEARKANKPGNVSQPGSSHSANTSGTSDSRAKAGPSLVTPGVGSSVPISHGQQQPTSSRPPSTRGGAPPVDQLAPGDVAQLETRRMNALPVEKPPIGQGVNNEMSNGPVTEQEIPSKGPARVPGEANPSVQDQRSIAPPRATLKDILISVERSVQRAALAASKLQDSGLAKEKEMRLAEAKALGEMSNGCVKPKKAANEQEAMLAAMGIKTVDDNASKRITLECLTAKRKVPRVATKISHHCGVPVILCDLRYPAIRFPKLIIHVPTAYPKVRPKVSFERPPIGWVGPIHRVRKLFLQGLERLNASHTKFAVVDLLELWSRAGEIVSDELV